MLEGNFETPLVIVSMVVATAGIRALIAGCSSTPFKPVSVARSRR
jgi:hypothetical protein